MIRTAQEALEEFRSRGISVAAWSRHNGFNPTLVYQVLHARSIPARRIRHHTNRAGRTTQQTAILCRQSDFSAFRGAPAVYCFYLGIVLDLAALSLMEHRMRHIPVHTEHLIERVGLLTIFCPQSKTS
jgi:gp16 family phage-associated protein